jgi:hypothetical protein
MSLVWEAFSTLSKPELRDLDRFVRSPFFNRKAAVAVLFDYYRTCRQQAQEPVPAAAWAAIDPGKGPFDDQKLRLANSDLLEVLEHYWMYCGLFADRSAARRRLAGMYRQRNLPRHFRIALREARQAAERTPWRHAEHFEAQQELETEQFRFAAVAKRYEAFNLQEISDLLDLGFIARKLRHVGLALSHQAVFKTTYRFGLYEAILEYVERHDLLRHPAIALYYHACRFLGAGRAEDHFFHFRSKLSESADQFPPDELRSLYLLAINFGIKKSNEPQAAYYRHTFDLYREALQRDLLLENGLLSPFAYNNITGLAIRLGETDWAETFIHRYKPLLERRHREQSFSLNAARLAYIRKDYRSALLLLQQADYKDLINSMNAKTLQLKIYYETGETDLLESHLDSMKTYLRRQEALGYHRENYRNIVRYGQALLTLNANDPGEITALRAQVETEAFLTEREWFLEVLAIR